MVSLHVSPPSHRSARRRARLVLGVALPSVLLFASSALAGPVVGVRVEGESATLLPLTAVTLENPEPVSGCPANSANAAINLAVNGDWDHGEAFGSGGDFTQTVLGETHAFTKESDTWAIWINNKWAGGICGDLLSEGDEVLLIADHEPEPTYAPTRLPLVIAAAPASAVAGSPFTARVDEIHTREGSYAEPGEGSPVPVEGASVSGGGLAASSEAGGMVTLTAAQAGLYSLIARKSGDAPSAPVRVCVRGAGESGCGVDVKPNGRATGELLGYSSASYRGPFALVAHVANLVEHRVYRRAHAPRLLQGKISAHDAVSSVSLRLRRRIGRHCFAFDGAVARFRPAHCRGGSFFKVSSSGAFSYLLPAPLARGRYVLDVEATDVAGNRITPARGTSRTVFYVR
jgi:hypothetical protein